MGNYSATGRANSSSRRGKSITPLIMTALPVDNLGLDIDSRRPPQPRIKKLNIVTTFKNKHNVPVHRSEDYVLLNVQCSVDILLGYNMMQNRIILCAFYLDNLPITTSKQSRCSK